MKGLSNSSSVRLHANQLEVNMSSTTLINVGDKPRREIIHLYPLSAGASSLKDLQNVVDNNGVAVKGNKLFGEPDLYQIAGLPDTITDAQCHGAQLEFWAFRGAQMRRDICPRVIDAPQPDTDNDTRITQVTAYANKLSRRRQNYRERIEAGLMPSFETSSKLFAEIFSEMTDDQLFLVCN